MRALIQKHLKHFDLTNQTGPKFLKKQDKQTGPGQILETKKQKTDPETFSSFKTNINKHRVITNTEPLTFVLFIFKV